jgi:hypothetical protein
MSSMPGTRDASQRDLVFLAASPAWSLVVVAVDVAVIHAVVVVHGGELETPS